MCVFSKEGSAASVSFSERVQTIVYSIGTWFSLSSIFLMCIHRIIRKKYITYCICCRISYCKARSGSIPKIASIVKTLRIIYELCVYIHYNRNGIQDPIEFQPSGRTKDWRAAARTGLWTAKGVTQDFLTTFGWGVHSNEDRYVLIFNSAKEIAYIITVFVVNSITQKTVKIPFRLPWRIIIHIFGLLVCDLWLYVGIVLPAVGMIRIDLAYTLFDRMPIENARNYCNDLRCHIDTLGFVLTTVFRTSWLCTHAHISQPSVIRCACDAMQCYDADVRFSLLSCSLGGCAHCVHEHKYNRSRQPWETYYLLRHVTLPFYWFFIRSVWLMRRRWGYILYEWQRIFRWRSASSLWFPSSV